MASGEWQPVQVIEDGGIVTVPILGDDSPCKLLTQSIPAQIMNDIRLAGRECMIWDQGQGLLIVNLGMWSIILYYLCSFMSNLQWMIWRIRFKGLPDFLAKVQLIVSSYDSSYALMHLSPSIVIHEWHSMRECVQRHQRFQRGTLHVMLGHWSHSSMKQFANCWSEGNWTEFARVAGSPLKFMQ